MLFDGSLMYAKRPREKNEEYLEFIRARGCIVCPNPADAHHLVTVKNFGSDMQTIGLCRSHHQEFHAKGKLDFNKKYRCDVWKEAHKALLDYFREKKGA